MNEFKSNNEVKMVAAPAPVSNFVPRNSFQMSLSCAEPVTVHALLAAFHFPCIANGWGAIHKGKLHGKGSKANIIWEAT